VIIREGDHHHEASLDVKTPAPVPVLASLAFLLSAAAFAVPATRRHSAKVTSDRIQTGSDIPADWKQPQGDFDYTKRDIMIPIRDGVKLHTVIPIPKQAHDLPTLLERTPYKASGMVPNNSLLMADAVWSGDKDWPTAAISSSGRTFAANTDRKKSTS
jgi:predicted acyl esterase